MSFPKPKLILDYNICIGAPPPKEKISLLGDISKIFILYELCALNYRLKPRDRVYFDTSLDTQKKELWYFAKNKTIFDKYGLIAERYTTSNDDYPIIFNRPACLYAIEEILNCDTMNSDENFVIQNVEQWESIIKYLLAVNYEISQIKEEEKDDLSFETLNPKLIPLNEFSIESHPVFTPHRGYLLMKHFIDNPRYARYVKEYFLESYGIEFDHFIFHLMSMYIMNKAAKLEFEFCYQVMDKDKDLFDRLSKRSPNKETYKLLSIKKSPFIKHTENVYLITDNTLLIEKSYSLFVNDLWFDKIKKVKDDNGNEKFTIKDYKGEFGYFFEKYLGGILRNCFGTNRQFKLLLFDELKINTGKGQIELADIYCRYYNKILIAQVKSGSIYDREKYGGNIETLYKNDRNKFFEDFGVNQTFESIKNIHEYMKTIDTEFPEGCSYKIFPCIIVNDKALQTPLMAQTFNIRFQELLTNFDINRFKIMPLLLIHISDFEELEMTLHNNPKKIWEILEKNCNDKTFISSFSYKIKKINSIEQCPQRIRELFYSLIKKYTPKISEQT